MIAGIFLMNVYRKRALSDENARRPRATGAGDPPVTVAGGASAQNQMGHAGVADQAVGGAADQKLATP